MALQVQGVQLQAVSQGLSVDLQAVSQAAMQAVSQGLSVDLHMAHDQLATSRTDVVDVQDVECIDFMPPSPAAQDSITWANQTRSDTAECMDLDDLDPT